MSGDSLLVIIAISAIWSLGTLRTIWTTLETDGKSRTTFERILRLAKSCIGTEH